MQTIHIRLPVQWGDMDALGHVNNTVYFRWFEGARIALFESVGLMNTGTPRVGPILATTSCTFLAPVRFPAEITCSAVITRVGRTSFGMAHVVRQGDVPVAKGEGVVVLVDYETGEKVPVPAALRAQLEALGGEA